jgi:HEAT repeat protein
MVKTGAVRRRILISLALAGYAGWQVARGGNAMADDPDTRILSADFTTADQALAAAIGNRDPALVARALGQRHMELRVKAASALADIGNKASVPALIEALARNEAPYAGGSESTILQADLSRALIAALQKLTGLTFGSADPPSPQDISRALRLSREWWEKNRN